MNKKLFIDHTFCVDRNHKLFKSLKNKGFTLSDIKVEHPGDAHCRFIVFSRTRSLIRPYLEFVNYKSDSTFFNKPGISFGVAGNLKSYFEKILGTVKCIYLHKNYDWKFNSTDNLPGWNFIHFNKAPIRNIYTWFTQSEPSKQRKLPISKAHANSCYDIYGIELCLTAKAIKFYEEILNQKISERTKLADGRYLFIKKGRVNRYEKIILKCRSLKKMKSFIKDDFVIFDSKESLCINSTTKQSKMPSLFVVQA